jgi:hypothetical protein
MFIDLILPERINEMSRELGSILSWRNEVESNYTVGIWRHVVPNSLRQ